MQRHQQVQDDGESNTRNLSDQTSMVQNEVQLKTCNNGSEQVFRNNHCCSSPEQRSLLFNESRSCTDSFTMKSNQREHRSVRINPVNSCRTIPARHTQEEREAEKREYQKEDRLNRFNKRQKKCNSIEGINLNLTKEMNSAGLHPTPPTESDGQRSGGKESNEEQKRKDGIDTEIYLLTW